MNTPRFIHNHRPVQERIMDEHTDEILIDDAELWSSNYNVYDLECIDNSVPDSIHISIEGDMHRPTFFIEGTESYIKIIPDRKGKYLASVYTDPQFRGQCHASYLMREVVNYADSECIQLSLDANPFDMHNAGMTQDQLVNFYSQYGFEVNKPFHLYKDYTPMIRAPICK